MNSKVSTVIAVELGLLILLLGWFAFGKFVPQTGSSADRRRDIASSYGRVIRTEQNPLVQTDDQTAAIDPGSANDQYLNGAANVPAYAQEVLVPADGNSGAQDLLADNSPYVTPAAPAPVVAYPDQSGSYDQSIPYYPPDLSYVPVVEYVQPAQVIVLSNDGYCSRPAGYGARFAGPRGFAVQPRRPFGDRLQMPRRVVGPMQNPRLQARPQPRRLPTVKTPTRVAPASPGRAIRVSQASH